ncbi:MAG TPA: DUF308 domain-containing protein [Terriglobales bacterium]|nr:DUF308 domain-containing protein [Terriglobales bacterium]
MSNPSFVENPFHRRLRAASNKLLWIGVAMVVLGIAAVVFPLVSSKVVALLVGWLLLFFGLLMFFNAFSIQGTGPFFGSLLLGLLSIACGIYLLFNPLVGEVALTLMVGMIFMLQGAFGIAFAFDMRPLKGWVGMLLSAIASIVLSILIMAHWPAISTMAMGIIFGVDFIVAGIALISAGSALKPAKHAA